MNVEDFNIGIKQLVDLYERFGGKDSFYPFEILYATVIQINREFDDMLLRIDVKYTEGRYDDELSLNESCKSSSTLNLDECTVKTKSDSSTIMGQLEIILHPVYKVPCPYIRLWNRSGTILSTNDFRHIIHSIPNSAEDIRKENDHRIYSFGTLGNDDHPLHGNQWLTIHCCEISKYMSQMLSTDEVKKPVIYILSWFSLIGPYIGLSIHPQFYVLCYNASYGRLDEPISISDEFS